MVEIPAPKPSLLAIAAKSESSSWKNVASPMKKVIDKAPVAALVVSVGAGAFGFKMYQDRSSAVEKRQFRLLMDGDGSNAAAVLGSSSSTCKPHC